MLQQIPDWDTPAFPDENFKPRNFNTEVCDLFLTLATCGTLN